MRHSWRRFLNWYDRYGLLSVAGFLLAFIPLYPKIPLFSPIEEYVVRIRLEDFAIALGLLLTLIQLLRRRARLYRPILILMTVYALVGLLSLAHAIFIIKIIPLEFAHLAKSALHFFRYLEYFALFFIGFAAVRRRRDLVYLFSVSTITVFIIAFYGYMQKFFYWPVYSTMNREFSKGIRLVLTEYARIQSTFAGHYDMAAYLVITLPLLFSFALSALRRRTRLLLSLVFGLGFWLMVMSASRIPFAALLVGIALVILGSAWKKTSFSQKMASLTQSSALFALFLFFMLYYFGHDLLNRLSNLISKADEPILLSQVIDDFLAPLPLPNSTQLLTWLPKSARRPDQSAPAPDLEEAMVAQVATINDQMPVPKQPTPPNERPRDVYLDIPDQIVTETTTPDGQTQLTIIHKPRVYSECAMSRELSLCIRLDSLWPWALQSFHSSPWLGTGYATLNKQYVEEFTFVDGTDNNYLRTLGETGILGFLTFYGILLFILILCAREWYRTQFRFYRALCLGFFAATVALLINASYIDVFAASKVAQSYWLLAGIVFAAMPLYQSLPNQAKSSQSARS